MTEMVPTISMLAQAFRSEPAPGARGEARPMLGLRPRSGVPVILRPA
jgi:hypothetical protein